MEFASMLARNPNLKFQILPNLLLVTLPAVDGKLNPKRAQLIRISDFGLLSDFGFRASDLLPSQTLFHKPPLSLADTRLALPETPRPIQTRTEPIHGSTVPDREAKRSLPRNSIAAGCLPRAEAAGNLQ